MYVKRYILGISLTHKAELERILVGYLVKTFIKGRRRQPIRLSNKGRKYLTSNSLGARFLCWRSYSLGYIGLCLYRNCNLYTVRLEYYRGLVLI